MSRKMLPVCAKRLAVLKLLLLASLTVSFFSFAAKASEPDKTPPTLTLNQVLKNWQAPTTTQDFKEIRYDSLLDLNSHYQGRFRFTTPEDFEIVYRQPIQGSIHFQESLLTVSFPKRQFSVQLDKVPEMARFLIPVKALLGGQPLALQQAYQMHFKPLPNHQWQLELTPKQFALLTAESVTVKGVWKANQAQVLSVKWVFKNGDWRQFNMAL